jgi:predicted PurR-regulated permease PerM
MGKVGGAVVERSRASGSSTAYTVIGLVFALLIGGYFVYRISSVVLAFLLTILLSIILAAPVNYLERRGWPRTWGALAVLAVFVGLVWLFGLAIVPAVETQSREFAKAFPTLLDKALALVNQAQSFFGLGTQIALNPGASRRSDGRSLPGPRCLRRPESG